MPQRILQGVAAIVFCLLAASAFAEDTRPRGNDEQLRAALDDIREAHGVPGMAAVLFDAEGQRSFAVGELGDDAGPVTPESRFRLGQVSLLFTALAAAALQADGSLSADTELRRVTPEIDLHNPWSTERPVRLEDLLAHRAGLGAVHFRDVYTNDPAQPLLAGINRAWRALRLEHRPGEREQYSAAGYAIAAYFIEKAVAMPYERVLQRLLFEPLELTATVGPMNVETQTGSDSRGHAGRPARELASLPLNLPTTGDIWMSAQDLGRVGSLLLNRGRHGERELLPADAIAWMEAAPNPGRALVPGSRRGVFAEEHGGILYFTQTGALPGFVARFAYSPELGGYAVLLNRGDAAAALAAADALLRGQLVSRRPAAPAPATTPDAALAGWYRNVRPDSPPRRLYRYWLDVARADVCGTSLCFQGLSQPALKLERIDDTRLRERGRWFPGWDVRTGERGVRLETATATWTPMSGMRVFAHVATAVLLTGGVLLGLVLLPLWTVKLVKTRAAHYHALTPRLLPLAAVLTVPAAQLLLFATPIPALAEPSTAAIAIMLLTVATPVLAVLALAAAIAGFFWQQSRSDMTAALYLALSAAGLALLLWHGELIAFQSWKY